MKKVMFRSAVAGYNKKDVNEYIASADAHHAEETAEAERRITGLEAELETNKNVYEMKISGLEEAAKSAQKRITELEGQLSEARANAARDMAAVRDELRAAKAGRADAEGLAARQNDELSRLRTALAAAKGSAVGADELADLRRRAAAYDELEARRLTVPQAGAEAEADNVIQSARTEAEVIRREARLGGAAALEETKKQVSGELAEIYEMINRAAAESVEDILANMRAAESGVGKIGEQLHSQNLDAVARVESVRAEIEKLIEKKFDEARSNVEKADGVAAPNEKPAAQSDRTAPVSRNTERRTERQSGRRQESHDRAQQKGRRDGAGEGLFRFGRRK